MVGFILSELCNCVKTASLNSVALYIFFSVVVGEKSAVFGSKLDQVPANDEEDDIRDDDGASIFSSSWLPGSDSRFDSSYLPLWLSLYLSLHTRIRARRYMHASTHIFFQMDVFFFTMYILLDYQKLLCDATIFEQGQAS